MLPLLLFAAASADSTVIEEIVVTALKRETTLQDTPLAISAASGETLVTCTSTTCSTKSPSGSA
jgi:iron complex outermembrane recepter protein